MISLLLLGPSQILLDHQPIDIARRKSRALLYYLAVRSAPVTREHVLALFWPDHERAAAQQVLRTTLHGLRKTLGTGLVITNETLGLASNAMVDTRRFEAQLAAPSSPELLALTLALYRGPLLEDFTLPDSEAFELWLESERERFRKLALYGFLRLAQLHEAQQNLPAALGALTRALALDPLHEDIQRAAMRVQYRSGDRAGAIRRYEQLRDQLDEELGVPPMAETRALYDAIITDALEEPQNSTPREPSLQQTHSIQPVQIFPRTSEGIDTLPFIGRTAELAKISAAATAGKLVLIEGEPGIGKTRLAREWMRQANVLPLLGAAYELERALPYQPLIGALRGLSERNDWAQLRDRLQLAPVWRAEVARLLPELGDNSATPAADEPRLWEGVRQLLLALAKQVPLALFLDDLHWADESTLVLLGYLARQPGNAPIRYLATTRAVAARSGLATLVQTLTRADQLERIQVQRLTATEMQVLAQRLSLANADALSEWLERSSEGNPYVLAELVRHARERNWLQPNGALDLATLSDAPVVPRSIGSLIESRLEQLSPEARRVLDVAVAVGREFEFPIVTRAAGMTEPQALDALDELRMADLVRPLEDVRFTFDHSLTMEVAYRDIGEPRHRLMHHHVGEAMEQVYRERTDEVAGIIAAHFAEGGDTKRAATYALAAGHRAVRLAAWQEAIAFFELALRGGEAVDRGRTLLALGDARDHAGASAAASETLQRAVQLAEVAGDEALEHEARIALARTLLPQGRYADIISTVEPLLESDEAASAEFLWGAALSLEGADLAGASVHLRRSAELLGPNPRRNDVSLARVKFELGGIAAQQGDLEGAVRLYREVLEVAHDDVKEGALGWYILGHNNLAYHLHLLNDPTAIEYARTGLALAQDKGMLGLFPYLLSTIGEILLAAGELDRAEQSFVEGLALSERLAMPERIAGLTANLGLIAIQRGQRELAIHRLSTALARADALGTQHLGAQIRIWLAPLLPPDEARAVLAAARALAESGGRKRLLAEIDSLEDAQREHSSTPRGNTYDRILHSTGSTI